MISLNIHQDFFRIMKAKKFFFKKGNTGIGVLCEFYCSHGKICFIKKLSETLYRHEALCGLFQIVQVFTFYLYSYWIQWLHRLFSC